MGVPLAYLFIKTSKSADKGAKQHVLENWLDALKNLVGVCPDFILTDKDWLEINAARKIWPQSKH